MNFSEIFFLPVSSRPKTLPPMTNDRAKARYWHCGVIFEGKVYESFGNGKFNTPLEVDRRPELVKQDAFFTATASDPNRLLREVSAGTTCAQYVLRSIGLSKLSGSDPGHIQPDELAALLTQGVSSLRFPYGDEKWVRNEIQKQGHSFITRVDQDIRFLTPGKCLATPWSELLYVKAARKLESLDLHPCPGTINANLYKAIQERGKKTFVVAKVVRA